MVIDWPPHPSHPADHRRAYILNAFVEPKHRRKGLAKRLMALAETRARELVVSYAILHSTRQGRALYECLGWGPTSRDGDPLGVGCSIQDDLPIRTCDDFLACAWSSIISRVRFRTMGRPMMLLTVYGGSPDSLAFT